VGGASPGRNDGAPGRRGAGSCWCWNRAAATREALGGACWLGGMSLLEGVALAPPRRLLVRTLALALDVKFQRIQFTPRL